MKNKAIQLILCAIVFIYAFIGFLITFAQIVTEQCGMWMNLVAYFIIAVGCVYVRNVVID